MQQKEFYVRNFNSTSVNTIGLINQFNQPTLSTNSTLNHFNVLTVLNQVNNLRQLGFWFGARSSVVLKVHCILMCYIYHLTSIEPYVPTSPKVLLSR